MATAFTNVVSAAEGPRFVVPPGPGRAGIDDNRAAQPRLQPNREDPRHEVHATVRRNPNEQSDRASRGRILGSDRRSDRARSAVVDEFALCAKQIGANLAAMDA